jgi:stalled ribosome alternative rescue factor ArfA
VLCIRANDTIKLVVEKKKKGKGEDKTQEKATNVSTQRP